MKYIRFDQATAEIYVPNVGPIPFYLEDNTVAICVELDKQEIKDLVVNNGRLWILTHALPGGDRPPFIKPQTSSPFTTPKPQDDDKNASKNNGAPGQGPRNDQ